MILQALNELYERLAGDASYGIAPPGFSPQKVSFKIVLHPDGSLFEPQAVDPKVHTRVLGEGKSPGSGINPCFLWDNQTYLLGRQPEDKKAGLGQERFEAFKQRHLEVEKTIDSPAFSAVCRFLERWDPQRIAEFSLLNEVRTGFGVFQLLGERGYVHDDPNVLRWWESNQPKEDKGSIGQCLITGDKGPIARLHPKIKGITGAQSLGASIVSFNDSAYESYGKSQSYNSPVSIEAANRYSTALNALLTGPMAYRHRMRMGDTTCVFWTESPTAIEDLFADLIGSHTMNAKEQTQDNERLHQLKELIRAIRRGGNYQGDAGEPGSKFYLLGLAPNAARISIRFFHRSSVGELLQKLHEHHRCIAIVPEYDGTGKGRPDPEFPPPWMFLRQTVRRGDDVPPLLGGALMRAIITGGNYPEGLYAAILRRIHTDRTINYLRAALIKAVLVRNHKLEIPTMLDTDNTDPAYRLGRLFAALEKTQQDALPGTKATIRHRFYSSASATPRSVFSRLLRSYQHHLAKLPEAAKVNRERLIQEIMDTFPADGFPAQMNTQGQGKFAIGYYHQRKAFFTAKTKETETAQTETL